MIDLVIKNANILTVDEEMREYEKGYIMVNNGIIVGLGHMDKCPEVKAVKEINASNMLIMPGIINSHTHAAMSYFKGLADDLPLHEWLNNYIWPAEKKLLNDEFVYYASLHGIAEMIKCGTTMFNDMYFFGDFTVKAAIKAGIKCTTGEAIVDFPVHNYNNAGDIISYSLNLKEKYRNENLIDVAIAPHSIYTCGKDTLITAFTKAREHNLKTHLHLSETKKEVEDCLTQTGMKPVFYLDNLGLLNENLLLVHGVWVDEDEARLLREKKVTVVICTESNLKLGSGFTPLERYYRHGIHLCLGTDSVASNNNLDLFQEMDITAKLHKALSYDPSFINCSQLIKMATINGAKALGKENFTGSLEMNKDADFIIIDLENVESQPIFDIKSHVVYSIGSRYVRDVFIKGKRVLEEGKLTTIDEGDILDRSQFYKKKIKETLQA